MLWAANSIQDFTKADRQNSPSEELIVSWPVHWVTIFWRDDQVSFLECFQIMMFLCYFFVPCSTVFLPPFFFLWKYSPKIGVRIIHGRALCTGKYGICYNLLNNLCLNSLISTWNLYAKHLKEWNLCKPTQVFFFFWRSLVCFVKQWLLLGVIFTGYGKSVCQGRCILF